MTPKKNTVLWWMLRIEDKELRDRAVRACVNPNWYCNKMYIAIHDMCPWGYTEKYAEGSIFWTKIYIQAYKNLIPLLPEPYTEPTVSVTEITQDDDGWISVNDRLPDSDLDCFIFEPQKGRGIAHYNSDLKVFAIRTQPTYWQPLPNEPKIS